MQPSHILLFDESNIKRSIMLSTNNLIKLNGEQVEKSDFPTGCPVYICNDHTPAYIQSYGVVVGVFLKMGSVLGMFCKVRNGENEDIVPQERLRFRTDCPVQVTQGERQLEGVILGFCGIPDTNKHISSTEDTYWYSILLCESKRVIHEVSPDQVSFRSMARNTETSIPKEVVIREAGDISVLPSFLDPPPKAVVIDLMNVKEEPIDDQEMEVDQGRENTQNNNRILSFQESDCQNVEVEVEVEVNTEFQHADDGYSDDSDDNSSSSSIVEIPMPDMNLQIEASGEDEIVHDTEVNTSNKISSCEAATFDQDNGYQSDSSSRKSSTENVSSVGPAPLSQDNGDQSVKSSKKSPTEKISSGGTAPLTLDNETQSDNSSNKRYTDNTSSCESASLNLNNEDQRDNSCNKISNDKSSKGETTPLAPSREDTNSDCTKKLIIGKKRSIDEISNSCGTSPLLGNEEILSEDTKKQNIGKKRSIDKVSIVDSTIDLSGDISESEDVQTSVNTSLPTNRDINSFKICRRVKAIGTGPSLLGSMLQGWRSCPPVQGEATHKEFQGNTYYWCSKCKNLNGTWALHHQEDHRVDDRDYHISHWTEKAPNCSQSPTRREGEKWYNWCNECRNEKGQWTSTHKLGDHWKYIPPEPSSRLSKTKGSFTFHWCKKCRDGLGMWSMHSEQNHRDKFTKRVGEDIRTQNPFHLSHMFSRFIQSDGEILSTLKSKLKTVPRSHWTSGSMCLTFHLMGYCLKNCRRAEDHRELCSSDADKLYDWCLESSVEKTEVAPKSLSTIRTTKEKKIRNSKSRANIPPKANAPPKGKGSSIQKKTPGFWHQKIVLAEVKYHILRGVCASREI